VSKRGPHDAASRTISAYNELNRSGSRVLLGDVAGLGDEWFGDNRGAAGATALAGIMTSHGTAPPATFVYDYFRVDRTTTLPEAR
jgi:hypothetical protein